MNPINRILKGILRRGGRLFPDKFQIEMYYRLEMGKKLDLKNPKTMNEKLQWLKLYNRKEEYRDLVDKVKVKAIVAKKIGEQYVVPLLGVWDSFDDIDFDKLPDQFVLKTNHSGGNTGVIVVPNKSKLNKAEAKAKLDKSLKSDVYRAFREWPYQRNRIWQHLSDDQYTKERNQHFHQSLKVLMKCSDWLLKCQRDSRL